MVPLSRFDMLKIVQDYGILRAKLQANDGAILFAEFVESNMSASRKLAEARLLTSKIPSLLVVGADSRRMELSEDREESSLVDNWQGSTLSRTKL
jgi:hypothetical protein